MSRTPTRLNELSLESGHRDESFYRRILENLTDGVYFVDTQRRITYWNRAACAITGYSAAEVIGRSCHDNLLVHTDTDGCQLCLDGCPLTATLVDRTNRQADVFLKHRNGHRVPVSVRVSPILGENGDAVGGVEVFSENSTKLAALEKAAAMEQLALIDPLTSVGNRRYTQRVLTERCDQFRRHGNGFAVLFADLDHFKAVNDTYGHEAGDVVLQAAARTLANNLRTFDFLGRWGGEEFIAILTHADAANAITAAARCCSLVRSCRVDFAGQAIRPTISIGLAVSQSGESPDEIVARADANMYLAKRAGWDRICGP